MAKQAETPIKRFVASGGQTRFNYGTHFTTRDATRIKVKQNTTVLTQGVHYRVNIGTNVVTLTSGATNGDIVVVYRQTPITRLTNFRDSGAFRPELVDNDLDRAIEVLQELNALADLCLRYDITTDSATADTTLPAPRTGQVLIWDESTPAQITNGDA